MGGSIRHRDIFKPLSEKGGLKKALARSGSCKAAGFARVF